jgi:hypothetical protein
VKASNSTVNRLEGDVGPGKDGRQGGAAARRQWAQLAAKTRSVCSRTGPTFTIVGFLIVAALVSTSPIGIADLRAISRDSRPQPCG